MLTVIAVSIVCILLIVQVLKMIAIRQTIAVISFLAGGLFLTAGSIIYMQYKQVIPLLQYIVSECTWMLTGGCNLCMILYITRDKIYSWWKLLLFSSLLPAAYLIALCLFNYNWKEFAITLYPVITLVCWPFVILFASWMTEAGLSIPIELYSSWVYPVEKSMPEMKEEDLRDVLVIGLKLTKSKDDPIVTYMRARAPGKIGLGEFFFHFINDYNDRHPETPLQWQTENRPDEWIFYTRHKWFRYCNVLDPDLPVYLNKIKENTIIYCRRL
ncbi:TssN family type VI secretion system protein [Chitinophaga sp. Hz27]|uniref:TssN family type VI secretion system protein n=1 Tax=Chitinophaga sp. Hz27 TaxID=3347169 RepID=UPI0035D62E20